MNLLNLAAALSIAPNLSPLRTDDELFRPLTFEQALAAARLEAKVVFVDFFTTWCAPCKKLDATTWKDERVVAWLGEKAVSLKIDAEAEKELAARYGVQAYPTMIFIDGEAEELGRLVGYVGADEFLEHAPQALAGVTQLDRIEARLAERPNDPTLRQRRGELLTRDGRFGEALEELLWCFDHGDEHRSGYTGVRLSFLLLSIGGLGSSYPPAMEALREREEAARLELSSRGEGSLEQRRLPFLAHELAALNRTLGTPERTLDLWDRLRGSEEMSAACAAMFDEILDLLIDRGRYADVVEHAGDVLERVERRITLHSLSMSARIDGQAAAFVEGEEVAFDDGLAAFMKQQVAVEGAKFYRALLETDRVETATALSERLIEFDGSASTHALLARTAAAAEAFVAARELLEKGFAATAEDEQSPLRRAQRRVDRLAERARAQDRSDPVVDWTGTPHVADLANEDLERSTALLQAEAPSAGADEMARAVEVLLDASSEGVELNRRLEEAGFLPTEELFDALIRACYPTEHADAPAARRRLLAAGRSAFPALLAALERCALDTREGVARAEFANLILAEITGGWFGWRFDDPVHTARIARSWPALWEKVEEDVSFWERGDRRPETRPEPRSPATPLPFVDLETVMRSGERIRATTEAGTIEIVAGHGFERAYRWGGAERSAILDPRAERWYGSLGVYYCGPGDHWKEHDGITRGVLEEGRRDFDTEDEALSWIREQDWLPSVHTRDGLVVAWGTTPSRKQLNVEVWQIYVAGRKPADLPGARDAAIEVGGAGSGTK